MRAIAPVAPNTHPSRIANDARSMMQTLPPDHPHRAELLFMASAIEALAFQLQQVELQARRSRRY